jgi:stage II sporulation protein D
LATIAAERRAFALALAAAVAAFAAVGSCAPAPGGVPGPVPTPERPAETAEPEVRIGLAVGAPDATLGGGFPLQVSDPSGALVAVIGPGEVWRVTTPGSGIHLSGPGGSAGGSEALTVVPGEPGRPVRVNGRDFRGSVVLLRDRTGLTVVNRVGMEPYILGVVSAEMGRRGLGDLEALRAQAVVSRTYAMRNLRRWDAQGFDLYATVADQVYGGLGSETPEAEDAVRATRGLVLTFAGAPIDAFFYSTCGGTTAEGTEVFRGADRPYLPSVSDIAGDGTAYCSLSPRFHWREEWSGESLRATLRRTLPAAAGVPAGGIREVRDVRVARRTGSGRVGELIIALGTEDVKVDGPAVRQVLRPASGDLLRSSAFSLSATGAGRRITRLVAEGGGAGHGVGFCQWGAVGRSRAGQNYQQIVSAYYPGAQLERLY